MTRCLIAYKNLKNNKYGYICYNCNGYFKGGIGEKITNEIKTQSDLLKLNDVNFLGQKFWCNGEVVKFEELFGFFDTFWIEYIYVFLNNQWYIISDKHTFLFNGVIDNE